MRLSVVVAAIAASTITWVGSAEPAAASQASPWRAVARATTPAVADGQRRFAFVGAEGDVHVVNTASGRSIVIGTPSECRNDPNSAALGFKAIRKSTLMWQCAGRGDSYVELDNYLTGRRQTIDLRLAGKEDVYALGFGARWIRVLPLYNHVSIDRFIDRRPPHRVGDPDRFANHYDDLDADALSVKLCSPVRRFATSSDQTYETTDPFDDFTLAGRVGLSSIRNRSGYQRLIVQRCGGTRHVLSRCPNFCSPPQLSARYITWTTEQGGWLWNLHTRRRYHVSSDGQLGHTARALIRSRYLGGAWTISQRSTAPF